MDSLRGLEAEQKTVKQQYAAVTTASLIILFGGAWFYHIVEKLNWVDAVYFCTITLTTIGYGDIVPHTNAGKLFTAAYALMGIGIIATFANILVRGAGLRRQIRKSKKE
jgi:hypothetical protein